MQYARVNAVVSKPADMKSLLCAATCLQACKMQLYCNNGMLQTKELTQNTVFKRQHAALLCHHLHRLWVIHNSMNCAWALRRQIHDLQLLNADM